MRSSFRVDRYDWVAGLLLGALAGTVILGVGGRLAMRGIALHTGVAPGFSVGGSASVVFVGALTGLCGGALLVACRRLWPGSRPARVSVYCLVAALTVLVGLRPLDAVRVIAFAPLAVLFGVALHAAWCRVYLPRRGARASPVT